jgi:hypothetical protein
MDSGLKLCRGYKTKSRYGRYKKFLNMRKAGKFYLFMDDFGFKSREGLAYSKRSPV